jgi:NAD+ kinase
MPPIRKLAFVVNADKAGAGRLCRELMTIAREAGVRVKRTDRFPLPRGFLRGYDACCAIGGDGTLLSVAGEAARAQAPIIGVNRGSLGFLTTFSAEEARMHFTALLKGGFRVDRRSMLSCSAGPGMQGLALNDVCIKGHANSRLVRLEVFADDELVTDFLCDGLIFSTPTGSTAYNLSAGGPILHPTAKVIVMTPVCPHTLSNRSIIFREGVRLEVFNHSNDNRLVVSMDGQRNLALCGDGRVRISVAKLRLPLAQRTDYAHFSVVRTKLHWSGGLTESR